MRLVLELEKLGASVSTAAVDVADEGALAAWWEQWRDEERPAMRGVVHAAGVLDAQSRPVLELKTEAIEAGLRAKVLGGWNLHPWTPWPSRAAPGACPP